VFVPGTLSSSVDAVLGFDERPLARPHVAVHRSRAGGVRPDELARAYGFPSPRVGHKQTIAIILPYGGFRRSDLSRFFRSIGRKVPLIRTLNVEGRRNEPATREAIGRFCNTLEGRTALLDAMLAPKERGADSAWNVLWSVEAALDIELAGALAPTCDLLVCLIRDSPRGKFEGFSRAITHPARPAIISCSWSAHEHEVPPMLRRILNRVFMFATLRNITICCSSGDDGGAPGERKRVHFPASSPYVLACGGSSFPDPAGPRLESVWNEHVGGRPMSTSGGFSRAFPRPHWQRPHVKFRGTGRSGRAVPDVAAKADFARGYELIVGGRGVRLGGTSAATPAWAALVGCINDTVGRPLGFISPLLYTEQTNTALLSVTKGGNGTYRALRGWDPCTGLGTPMGAALLDLLGRRPSAQATRRRAPRQLVHG
jgi:kumamolisin